jgi:hypothetical protein
MGNLEQHAEFELRRAGLFDADSDYGGALGPAIMTMIRTFAAEGHSGGSAQVTLAVFERLARFKPLTPLTDDPAEWMDVAGLQGGAPGAAWQNRRQSSCFSTDGGKTYYDIDAGDDRAIRTSAPAVSSL